jgi:hypothetical protein
MHERIRFIEHHGKKILVVDFSNCPAQKVEEIARAVPDCATAQPLNSVLVLTDFTEATFNQDALRALKETAVFDKPFIKRSALLGTQSFPRDFYEEITSFSRRDLRIFTTRDEALTWLVGDFGER